MRTIVRIFGVLLVFLFGVFIGAAGTNAGIARKAREVMMGGPEAVMEVVVKRLDSELKLDAEQKRKLQTIVDDAHIKLRQSRARVQPEIDATLHEAEERVRDMLYPEQVEKFDKLINRSREKFKSFEKDKQTPKPEPQGSTPEPDKPKAEPGVPKTEPDIPKPEDVTPKPEPQTSKPEPQAGKPEEKAGEAVPKAE
jgi:hypothetical protein